MAQSDARFVLDPQGPRPARTLRTERIERGAGIYERYIQKNSGQELFRVHIGVRESILWRFGITAEGDFNADGRIDYAWYGGDDTASVHFLFLSCDGGYCAFNLTASLAVAYARKFRVKAPDLEANDYSTMRLTIHRVQGRLSISAYVAALYPRPIKLEAESNLWVPLKAPNAGYFPAGQATP